MFSPLPVFNGQTRAAEEHKNSLRARGRDGVHGKEKNSVASARTSTTHNLRPNRAVQEQKQQVNTKFSPNLDLIFAREK